MLIRLFDSFVDALREAAGHVVADNRLHDGVEAEGITHAHRTLVEAIAAGDPDAAVAATQANLDHTLDRLRATGTGPR